MNTNTQDTVECGQCEGEGRITVQSTTLTEDGHQDNPPVEMDCIGCDGTGSITAQEARMKEERAKAWCACEDEGDDVTFHPDGDTQHYNGFSVTKHHWSCDDCGMLRQVG